MSLFAKKQSDAPRRRSVDGGSNKSDTSSDIFKRNRTLTGTTSNRLDSTNTRTGLESPRTHAHYLSIQRRKISSILLIVFIALTLVWLLVSNLTATVVVSVSDTTMSKPINNTTYEKIIQDYLDMNPLSRLSFVLDQPAMSAYVSSKLPEVLSVTQRNMLSIGRSNFAITMRTPVAGWQINGKQYYVDSKGIPFEQNYFSTSVVQIIDNSGVVNPTGTTAIASNRFLSFVGRVVYLSKASGFTVISAALPENTTRELEIRLKEGNYLVKLSIDRPAGEQVEDMVGAVRYFVNHNQTPQYIDVRVSGKAIYR